MHRPPHHNPADGTRFRDYPVRYVITYSCGCQIESVSPTWSTHSWPIQCPKWWHRNTKVERAADMELVDRRST